MYEDSWYSYVPESTNDDGAQSSKHRRRESLLKQPNGSNQIPDPADPLMKIFEEESGIKGPPRATLARRAKSYSDFHEVAIGYFGTEAGKQKPKDALEFFENGDNEVRLGARYEEYENGLLDASHEEYQLYKDQLALSERHLDSLLEDSTSALDLLATLSESFKAVESQTTAFQAQCEDLLTEQKRLRDLADEVGTDLQYYAYLEPLSRRLNAPGAGRVIKSDDFLDMLTNLNTCIDFMDQHPNYRDSSIYKQRYTTLLERSLNLVSMAFATAVKEVADDVIKKLKEKDHNETSQYILLYGNFESIFDILGEQVVKFLGTADYAFGTKLDKRHRSPYIRQYHEAFRTITEAWLKGREPVALLVSKNLRLFTNIDPKPENDFQLFAHRCVQYVFDICQHEATLTDKFFSNGPILQEYSGPDPWTAMAKYSEKLEQNRLSHLKRLYLTLNPYLSNGDLHRICDLVNWLETTYMGSSDSEDDHDTPQKGHRFTAQVFLAEYLWPLSDTLFIKAAKELEFFKPSADDLKIGGLASEDSKKLNALQNVDTNVKVSNETPTPTVPISTAYPTVTTAVSLLVMYNDSVCDRSKGEVLYEIVHQALESLQRAATMIKRDTGRILDAQAFLIKNLMLIENLFMTHEIPDSIRQSAELDFTPIWETFRELQARNQLYNPLAYINPLVQGQLLPAVKDQLLDARKELEKVLVQQITSFTKHWQGRLNVKGQRQEVVLKANMELEELLNKVFDDTTKAGLRRMIRAEAEES